MKLPKPSFYPAVFWFFLTGYLLVLPGTRFPTENWFDKIWLDKWVHIGLFFILVWLWCRGTLTIKKTWQQRARLFTLIALAWFAYGVGMEFVQKYLVSNRSFDLGDIVADGIGCLTGWWYSWRTYIKK